jgi:hypothetical protein
MIVRSRWVASALLLTALCGSATIARGGDLSGYWEGTWHGCTDGFKGTVKACITKCDDCHYHAVFWGRAFKIMPYKYEATLTAVTDPATGQTRFKCNTKLPIWGCYWMKGCADDCHFFARYHTDDHVGYFKMSRVGCCD